MGATATMSDGGMFHDPAVAGVTGVLGTAVLAWLGQRLVGKAAIQEAINKSFHELMDQLRQELRVAINERDAARSECKDLHVKIETLQRTIKAFYTAETGGTIHVFAQEPEE